MKYKTNIFDAELNIWYKTQLYLKEVIINGESIDWYRQENEIGLNNGNNNDWSKFNEENWVEEDWKTKLLQITF